MAKTESTLGSLASPSSVEGVSMGLKRSSKYSFQHPTIAPVEVRFPHVSMSSPNSSQT